MDTLFIFGAKYLFVISPLIGAIYFLKSRREVQKEILIFAFFTLPLTLLVGKFASTLYMNERPFVAGDFTPLIPHTADNGFPSDHTLLTASIAAVFTFFNRKIALVLWLITFVVGFSRVYAGVHHTIDIVTSMVIALSCGYVVCVILEYIKNRKNKINE